MIFIRYSFVALALTCCWLSPSQAAEPQVNFSRDIRPLLSDSCFQCHGPDDKQRKAGLRLDIRKAALQAAESGEKAIIPHNVKDSSLLERVTSHDKDTQMPPPNSGKKPLTAAQVELLKKWIAEGAEYQGHWSFIPIQRPQVPEVADQGWSKTAVDHFVFARLAQEKLRPSSEAEKTTLLRRVTLDLTGLPPTPAEIQTFLADNSSQAYEKVVDRLLASPRYGEHMALQWLDFARYADSNGFQKDGSRFQWLWRDWLIHAYNNNLPFDQFTIQQLAGDLLPNATQDQIIATGFNRNHRLTDEGGSIPEEWRVETVIDRVETTGLTWLGLTLNCCRCHDHKYDPITQKEFYQLFAYFNNVPENGMAHSGVRNTDPVLTVSAPENNVELARMEKAVEAAEAHVTKASEGLQQRLTEWEARRKRTPTEEAGYWKVLTATGVKSTGGAKLTKKPDGSYLASGKNPTHDTYEFVAPLEAGKLTGLLLECFTDPSLPQKSLGRFSNGNFVLSRVEATLSAPSLEQPVKLAFAKVEADFSQADWDVQYLLNNAAGKGWAIDGPTRKENRKALFVLTESLNVPEKAVITVHLIHEAIEQHNIGRFRLSATATAPENVSLNMETLPENVKQALAVDADKRTAAQKSDLEKFFRMNVDPTSKQAEAALAHAKKQLEEMRGNLPNVMIMKEGPVREAHLLIRGQYDKKGDKVAAALPVAFPPMPSGAPQNRLGLAQWIVAPNNPLTARVWVNRAWERFFGTGLVKTSENLGSQAEFPSHPELLDWLAAEFMSPTVLPAVNGKPAQAWDMKAMHKLLVLSAVYRQSSHVASELAARDPENRLLARGPRFRLSGETLRDQALFTSGLLVEKVGGPSVRPYMPDGVWDETSVYGDLRGYKHDTDEGLHRRTMYTIWKRTAAPPTMLIFDAPNREICTVKRSRTNTPLQALSLLNEVTYVEAARKLGERMIAEGGSTPTDRVKFGFQLVTSRAPTDKELTVLVAGLESDHKKYQGNKPAAEKLLAFGDAARNKQIDAIELAAYTLTANVLLNLDEVVTRE